VLLAVFNALSSSICRQLFLVLFTKMSSIWRQHFACYKLKKSVKFI